MKALMVFVLGVGMIMTTQAQNLRTENGQCFLIRNNVPLSNPVQCAIQLGQGPNGEFTSFTVGKSPVYIAEKKAKVVVGRDADTLSKGVMYMRDYSTYKPVHKPNHHQPWYYCAKQATGQIDACYIIIE